MVTISVWEMGCSIPFFMVNIHEQILAAIYENTSVTMTCNIFQCASASKPISLYTVSRNIFMRTSQTHHYEFDGQTGDTGTNRFEDLRLFWKQTNRKHDRTKVKIRRK